MSSSINAGQTALLQRVAEFIWAEADLLDQKDYDSWLNLWTNDGHYILPISETEDYENTLNLAYDDAAMRRMRTDRFKAGFSISSAPAAETVRTMSRFVVVSATDHEVKVRCATHLIESKFGRQRSFAANTLYVLAPQAQGFLIRDKIVRLLNADGILTALSYLF